MDVRAIEVLSRAELRHVNIVRLHDVIHTETKLVLIFEVSKASLFGQRSHLGGVTAALEAVDSCLPPHSSANKT